MIVYIANADSKDIYVMRLDRDSGDMTLEQRAAAGGAVGPLALSPDRRMLYASLRSTPFSVASFAVDPATGGLRLLSTVPLADNMCYVSVDKTGRFLFGASYSGNQISINPIDGRGLVDADPIQVLPTPPHPHSIVIDPANRFVFVPSLGGDRILQFAFDPATGRVTPNAPASVEAKTGAGPRHFVFHPNRRFAYCANELDATVVAYAYDAAAGTLVPLGSQTLLPQGFQGTRPFAAADIHATPDGRYLYASERASNTITGFAVNGQTGALSPTGVVPTELHPRGFNIDPGGRFLVAVGQRSSSLSLYAIAVNGTLALRHRQPMGQAPNWVEVIELA